MIAKWKNHIALACKLAGMWQTPMNSKSDEFCQKEIFFAKTRKSEFSSQQCNRPVVF